MIGTAAMKPGMEISNVGAKPDTGDVIGNASREPRVCDVVSYEGTMHVMGDVIGDVGIEPGLPRVRDL